MLLNNKLIFINYLNFKYCKFYWLLFLVFYMYIFWPFFGRPKFKTWPFGHGQTAKRPTANSGQTANGQHCKLYRSLSVTRHLVVKISISDAN